MSKQLPPTLCWEATADPKRDWVGFEEKRGQQEQTLREGSSKREAANLLHLLLLQQPLLACASDGSWLPRNLPGLGSTGQTTLGWGAVTHV